MNSVKCRVSSVGLLVMACHGMSWMEHLNWLVVYCSFSLSTFSKTI